MPNWVTLLLLGLCVLLGSKGYGNRDDVIGLLELLLAAVGLLVVLFAGHHLLLELAGLAVALWLPRAREGMAPLSRKPESDDLLLPF
jgi:energy-converting hydrogenase Eha subunit E